MSEGYNGWSNYETWDVALWLDNDEGTYTEVREHVAEIVADEDGGNNYVLTIWLREYVSELAETTCPGVIEGASFVADMFQAALGEVDWLEIANTLLDEFANA